ncbi:accessory Sec system protein Asp2 [Lactobacillus sp. ESL0684]|uniref:accessory Sec system protein Asp2 n=1 Tax=Lactobacillus sp. ESL0684 TaxID=2983213 RepID=UPI0023F9915A|nr:accessory Sec system protein Asp2 [Lactobacillus sp. ESL0684]WEV43354.1 accessory Sec system protein Asp2 [Lactobacillus sp. ESL0684]
MSKSKGRTTFLFHSGSQPLEDLADALTDCTYLWADPQNMQQHAQSPVFKREIFNSKYLFSYFYLDSTSPWLSKLELLNQLPAYRVFYSQDAVLSEQAQAILDFRGAFKIAPEDVAADINRYLFDTEVGYRATIDKITVSPDIQNQVSYYGNTCLQIDCNFADKWHYVGRLAYSVSVPERYATELKFDLRTTGSAQIKIEVQCFTVDGDKLLNKFVKSGADLIQDHGKIIIDGIDGDFYYSVYYYVCGQGSVLLGSMHQRRSRGRYGLFELGGTAVFDQNSLDGEIDYLFNPGNLKPPLTVYFGGYHSAEVFEGRGILHSKGVPYLLLNDNRGEGGTFFIGDQSLVSKIRTIITDCLDQLHFTVKDLVLTGMSMGTFASLYYGAQLNPGGIVLGKPLLNLGTIAENLRINRPDDFQCAADMVLMLEGSDSHEACQKVDKLMWQQLHNGTFTNTDFIISYMKNDDYDLLAYNQLREFLQKNYPTSYVLAKAYDGRHNDATAVMSDWFERHIYQLLQSKYGQKF